MDSISIAQVLFLISGTVHFLLGTSSRKSGGSTIYFGMATMCFGASAVIGSLR